MGLTASSVASVSLTPPALVLSISHRASAAAALLAADRFLVHLLEVRNVELARVRPRHRMDTARHGRAVVPGGAHGAAVPPAVPHPGRDATVVTAEVVGVRSSGRTGPPLVHHDRGYHVLGATLPIS